MLLSGAVRMGSNSGAVGDKRTNELVKSTCRLGVFTGIIQQLVSYNNDLYYDQHGLRYNAASFAIQVVNSGCTVFVLIIMALRKRETFKSLRQRAALLICKIIINTKFVVFP